MNEEKFMCPHCDCSYPKKSINFDTKLRCGLCSLPMNYREDDETE